MIPMMVRRRVYLTVLLGFGAALAILVAAWGHNNWDLTKMALVGDAAAPIVGVLSLVAVAAGLWSVRIQHDALEVQREASARQQESLNAQLELQRQALEHQRAELIHQREALEAELCHQRHAALREAYSPFLSASGAYLNALHEYLGQLQRTNGAVDRRIRSEWQRPCIESYSELTRALDPVVLVDTSDERQEHRWRLTREVRLEPWVDSTENQKAWSDVILYRISERTDHHVALRNSLHKEFGAAVADETASARKFDEELRADLKAKADAVEQRIGEQLKVLARAEAVRSGRFPADTVDKKAGTDV